MFSLCFILLSRYPCSVGKAQLHRTLSTSESCRELENHVNYRHCISLRPADYNNLSLDVEILVVNVKLIYLVSVHLQSSAFTCYDLSHVLITGLMSEVNCWGILFVIFGLHVNWVPSRTKSRLLLPHASEPHRRRQSTYTLLDSKDCDLPSSPEKCFQRSLTDGMNLTLPLSECS